VSGYLIDGHDPAEYAERIGRLLADPERAQQMGRRGRLLAQRFSWTRTADRLEGLFEQEIEGGHALAQVKDGLGQARVHAGVRHE
jgi:D-inositol-3-phosphate glycosyltransferase